MFFQSQTLNLLHVKLPTFSSQEMAQEILLNIHLKKRNCQTLKKFSCGKVIFFSLVHISGNDSKKKLL